MPRYGDSAPSSGLYGHSPRMEEYTQNMRFAYGFADGMRDEAKSVEIPKILSDPVSPSYEAGYYDGREFLMDNPDHPWEKYPHEYVDIRLKAFVTATATEVGKE